jgi:hypothetical protein
VSEGDDLQVSSEAGERFALRGICAAEDSRCGRLALRKIRAAENWRGR